MACLNIKNPEGEVRTIAENTPYPPGWTFTGEISWDCDQQPTPSGPSVDEELAKHGVQWGDAIAWVTKKIGMKQCAPCKARQEILNSASELGWVETIKQIKGTF